MKNKLTGELAVCGMNAVKAIERAGSERITRFYFNSERAPLFGGLCKKLAARRVPYNCVEDIDLERLCGTVHHQGVVALIQEPAPLPLTTEVLEDWAARGEKILALNNIGNANNLGSIVRCAAFFGLGHIVVDTANPLTTSAYRVAEGGMEFVKVYAVRSIAEVLAAAKDIMVRVGTSPRGKIPARRLGSLTRGKAAVLVLGNEETGLSPETARHCDAIVSVAPQGGANIESLNVAQAAAVLLHELLATEGA